MPKPITIITWNKPVMICPLNELNLKTVYKNPEQNLHPFEFKIFAELIPDEDVAVCTLNTGVFNWIRAAKKGLPMQVWYINKDNEVEVVELDEDARGDWWPHSPFSINADALLELL